MPAEAIFSNAAFRLAFQRLRGYAACKLHAYVRQGDATREQNTWLVAVAVVAEAVHEDEHRSGLTIRNPVLQKKNAG